MSFNGRNLFHNARSLSAFLLTIFMGFLCLPLFSCNLVDGETSKESGGNNIKGELSVLQEEYEELDNKFQKQKQAYIYALRENEKLTAEITLRDDKIKEMEKEIVDLEEKLRGMEGGLYVEEIEKRIERLTELLNNINPILKHIYIGSSDPEEINYTFTAFSIKYNEKYYIITAGHCIADNYGEGGRFKFKANFSDEWIYPELVGYKAEFWNLDDYAVFYSDKVNDGLAVGEIETEDNYLPGSIDKGLSVFRHHGDSSKRGESGSPVINEYGEVIGIYVVYGLVYTPIQLALDLIEDQLVREN